MSENRRILIGIGGGIAVYRVAELARMLIRAGHQVRCVMTPSACEFVTPMTFEALTGEPVHSELFDLTSEREMGHIQLARWADAVIIAPATANILARIAHGLADNLLTTIMQVCRAPVLLAPAMNGSMWQSDATRRNVETLKQRGLHFVGPASGSLACGEEGIGRLSEPQQIIDALLPLLTEQSLAGQRWVINAGPTMEAWDAVRLLTNRASGTLGSYIASTAAIMGADVTLVAGPGTPDAHPLVKRLDVVSAEQMQATCRQEAGNAVVFIGTAAISDFRFAEKSLKKLKRGGTTSLSVELVSNPDIIAGIAGMEARPARVIAFAAESENHIEHAMEKLASKGVDAIVANDVSNMGSGSAGGWWLTQSEKHVIEASDKPDFARQIIRLIMEI